MVRVWLTCLVFPPKTGLLIREELQPLFDFFFRQRWGVVCLGPGPHTTDLAPGRTHHVGREGRRVQETTSPLAGSLAYGVI